LNYAVDKASINTAQKNWDSRSLFDTGRPTIHRAQMHYKIKEEHAYFPFPILIASGNKCPRPLHAWFKCQVLVVSVWHLLTQFVPFSSIVHSIKGHVMHLPSQSHWSHDWITVWKWAVLIRAGRPLLFCFRSLANVLLACTLIQYK